jgi:hypothetical protein
VVSSRLPPWRCAPRRRRWSGSVAAVRRRITHGTAPLTVDQPAPNASDDCHDRSRPRSPSTRRRKGTRTPRHDALDGALNSEQSQHGARPSFPSPTRRIRALFPVPRRPLSTAHRTPANSTPNSQQELCSVQPPNQSRRRSHLSSRPLRNARRALPSLACCPRHQFRCGAARAAPVKGLCELNWQSGAGQPFSFTPLCRPVLRCAAAAPAAASAPSSPRIMAPFKLAVRRRGQGADQGFRRALRRLAPVVPVLLPRSPLFTAATCPEQQPDHTIFRIQKQQWRQLVTTGW